MNYYELGRYKEKIISMFKSDEDIVDLIMPKLDDARFETEDNFLGGEFQTVVDGLIQKVNLAGHCFDVPFVYATVSDTSNLICIDTEITKANGESIKEVTVTIFVMFHKINLKLDSTTKIKYFRKGLSGNRLDMAVQAIGLQLNSSNEFGLGKFKPSRNSPVKSYYPSDNYFGKVLTYTCDDFMADYAKRSLDGK